MIHIKRFIDKVSMLESKRTKDLVISADEARGLRDEVTKLVADLYDKRKQADQEEVIQLEIKGGGFK